MIYKILSSSEQLSGTPSTISDANRVLIQNTGTDTTPIPHLITLKSDADEQGGVAVVGTFWIHQDKILLLKSINSILLKLILALKFMQPMLELQDENV